jgi:dolichol-phosphate mannosyltransferase
VEPPDLVFSVVVPVLDEAESVGGLLREVGELAGAARPREILVVDDGSRDATPARLRELLARGELPLRVLRHRQSLGQSAALRTGIAAARSEWVVTLDGDGQNDPADIPRLLDALARDGRGDLRLVCGWRRRREDAWPRRVASRVANAVRRALLRDETPDAACGLRLVHRATFLALPFFDHQHRFLPALVRAAGGRVTSVEVRHRARRAGRSKYGLGQRFAAGLVDLAGVLWLRRRSRRFEVEEIGAPDQSARRPSGERP